MTDVGTLLATPAMLVSDMFSRPPCPFFKLFLSLRVAIPRETGGRKVFHLSRLPVAVTSTDCHPCTYHFLSLVHCRVVVGRQTATFVV